MIDLRSDTQTAPSAGMRAAMAAAQVEDEQRREDPTVIALERAIELAPAALGTLARSVPAGVSGGS